MLLHAVTNPVVIPMQATPISVSHPIRQSSSPLSQPLIQDRRLPVSLYHRPLLPPAHCVNGQLSIDVENTPRLMDFIEIELKVRDYEVDHYGVVNNAVYSSYCQHAHHELLGYLGVNLEACGRSQPLAVSDLAFKFLAPLRNRDRFMIKVRVSHFSVARIFIEHYFYKLPDYQPILEAKSTLVWLDENHRPIRIPSEVKSKLTQLGLYK
ncbi:acyl-acyl carrier protein thioesterase ATL4, chloroplastic-like [Silene latifolia]|uniref:acyl-acyl carrier protein thioesterase ATL4, chloroplastic-like n=1 Tax=Silene latifolia TaxID=37657 RepID=UPI003D7829BF